MVRKVDIDLKLIKFVFSVYLTTVLNGKSMKMRVLISYHHRCFDNLLVRFGGRKRT